jgi:hypothetical protein
LHNDVTALIQTSNSSLHLIVYPCTSELRDGFWRHKINDIGDFMSSVYLHRLSDCVTFDILAGTYISFDIANEEELDV